MNEIVHILFVGESPTKSAPSLTWARALLRVGVSCKFIDFKLVGTRDWIKLSRQSDAIVVQVYRNVSPYLERMLNLSVLLGCPVIRKWSGSDVLNNLENAALRKRTSALNKALSLNLTSEHQGLVDELETIGVHACLTGQVIAECSALTLPKNAKVPLGVLIYLPTERKEFYGLQTVESVIRRNPDIEFTIIADLDHTLANYPNVTSLGWVDDMDGVWSRIGVLLRITKHDGFPRSVAEALARGKQVIHNQRLPGCIYATTSGEIEGRLREFIRDPAWNSEATDAMSPLVDGTNDRSLLNAIMSARVKNHQRVVAAVRIGFFHFGQIFQKADQ